MWRLVDWLNAVTPMRTEWSRPLPDPRKLSQLWGGDRREGVAGGTIIAHAVQFLRRKLRPREGHHPPHSHMTGPQRGGGTEDRVCSPPPQVSRPAHPILRLEIRNGRRERAAGRASWRQVALLKLGLVANLPRFHGSSRWGSLFLSA